MSGGRAIVVGLAILVGALAGPASRAQAQAPGYAEIVSPQAGDAVEGVVTIVGTADHPAFQRYDLAFSYAENPTQTWFALGEPVEARVRQGTLGLWDTSRLSPGVFQLRLRVHLENGAILEDSTTDLRLGLPAVPTAAALTPRSATPVAATPKPALAPLPTMQPETLAPPDPVGLAGVVGGVTTAAVLILMAIFLPLRRRLAVWGGSMRMRRVLREDERRRRGRDAR
jgi:hypothetical protein